MEKVCKSFDFSSCAIIGKLSGLLKVHKIGNKIIKLRQININTPYIG